jgi:hypothetical protein
VPIWIVPSRPLEGEDQTHFKAALNHIEGGPVEQIAAEQKWEIAAAPSARLLEHSKRCHTMYVFDSRTWNKPI